MELARLVYRGLGGNDVGHGRIYTDVSGGQDGLYLPIQPMRSSMLPI